MQPKRSASLFVIGIMIFLIASLLVAMAAISRNDEMIVLGVIGFIAGLAGLMMTWAAVFNYYHNRDVIAYYAKATYDLLYTNTQATNQNLTQNYGQGVGRSVYPQTNHDNNTSPYDYPTL